MTLLNGIAMFGVLAVIVPILVHLRKRRKSKVIDWPAMQFLTRTVTSRRRGVTLENLLLLLLRCLLVLLFVLAMARPVVESTRYFLWLIFFLLAGGGLLLLTATIVSQWQLRNRIIGGMVAALLFGVAAATLSVGPESLVDAEMDRDIALVIDRSLTMTLGDEETSHFDQAIDQARSLVGTLSGDSTVSMVVAGPIAETVDGSPFRNFRKAEKVLGTLAPIAGGSDLKSAIEQARSLLKRAPNTRKQILLLTDDQRCTWESIDDSIGKEVASEEGEAGLRKDSEAEIACAAIVARLPQKASNLSVDRLEIKSSLVTASRPIPIEVEVRNGGSTTIQNVAVKLLVDGREVASDSLVQIEPAVSSTVRFMHAFPKSGQHVVSGSIEVWDQLSEDNRIDSVIEVMPHLSILVVNGSTDADPAQQSATFAQLALDPTSLHDPPSTEDFGDADQTHVNRTNSNRAIIATTISAARINEMESLDNFQLVMLCDVPRLPIESAERLSRFVEDGGGLWVIPGEEADTTFYNNWRVQKTESPMMPAQLGGRSQWSGKASPDGRIARLGVALDVAGRPFLSDLLDRGGHDLADVSLFHFWSVTPAEQAIVGMRLTNDAVLFADHAVGRGRVLLQSVSLARRDSTFPTALGFPVLMHLWTQHVAASNGMNFNIEPTSDFLSDLTTPMDLLDSMETLQLSEPSGTTREIPVSWEQGSGVARVGRVVTPGVYQLAYGDKGATMVSRFAVHRNKEESDLSSFAEDRMAEVSRDLGIEFIDDVGQLTAPSVSETVGAEIWDTLLFIVLWLIAGECLVTKWIRSRRQVTPRANSDVHGLSYPMDPFATEMKKPHLGKDVAAGELVSTSVSVSITQSVGAP